MIFEIGDIIQNVDINSCNYGKIATVVGFHLKGRVVFVKYADGTYGSSDKLLGDYKKICCCCQCD